jgi:GNAT superfamily N-acetyltransferase
MVPWIFEHGTFWALALGRAPLVTVAPLLPVHFREVDRTHGAALAAAMGLHNTAPVFQRIDTGRRCFAAWIDEDIVAYGWFSQGMECVGELEQVFTIPANDGYIWDCATQERYRGNHLYSALLSYIAITLRDEGIFRLWIGAMSHNIASIRGFAGAGFQPVVMVT